MVRIGPAEGVPAVLQSLDFDLQAVLSAAGTDAGTLINLHFQSTWPDPRPLQDRIQLLGF
jgi:hypothetical protein